jgi:AraC-like DNA-binding protein
VGRTLSAQIWERRLIHAASQLQNLTLRNQTITQIAMASGFEDAAHFARAFKKRFDLSPSVWRARVEKPPTDSLQ